MTKGISFYNPVVKLGSNEVQQITQGGAKVGLQLFERKYSTRIQE